jgi:HlyD family secretion protein
VKKLIAGAGLAAVVVIGGLAAMSGDAAEPVISRASVTRGDLAETVNATGTLQAVTTVQVGTQVSGIVSALYADFNSLVKKGDVIARLDPSSINTQIEAARANLTRAQADVSRLEVALEDARLKLSRTERLTDQGILAKTELEAAQVAVASAEAQVRAAGAGVTQAEAALNQHLVSLQQTVIRAPIDGLVISRNVDSGQTVAASMSAPTLFVIAADLAEMQVVANLDESDVGRIRPDQRVTFTVDAYPGMEFEGRVTQVRLQPIVTSNVVSYATVIEAANRNLLLKPGMTANVTVEVVSRSDAVLIPNAALRFRPTSVTYEALGIPPPASTPPVRSPSPAAPMLDAEDLPPEAPRDTPKATSIDALFGPLERVETNGRVWTLRDRQLTPIPVRVGITDGQWTELVAGDLPAGTELITSVAAAGSSTRQPAASGGLFMPGGAASGRGR